MAYMALPDDKFGVAGWRLLACFAPKRIPRMHRCPHQPRVLCVGWLVAQRIFAPHICPTKNPPVRPYFKNKIFTKKNCCSFSARKHPTPPGTGTEPGSSSGLGSAPAPGTRQVLQALLAVGPPVGTDPREKKTGKPQVRTRPRPASFLTVAKIAKKSRRNDDPKKLSKFLFLQRAPRPPIFFLC